jgi:hypothetical protein
LLAGFDVSMRTPAPVVSTMRSVDTSASGASATVPRQTSVPVPPSSVARSWLFEMASQVCTPSTAGTSGQASQRSPMPSASVSVWLAFARPSSGSFPGQSSTSSATPSPSASFVPGPLGSPG